MKYSGVRQSEGWRRLRPRPVHWVLALAMLVFVILIAWRGGEPRTSSAVWFARGGAAPDRNFTERGNELSLKIAEQVRPFMDAHPGVALTVGVIDEKTSAVLGFGRRGSEDARPPDLRTIYEIGSITKVFTATCLELLAERGAVRLDDPVEKYFRSEVHIPDYQGKKITLLHLTTHSSGLPRMPDNFAVRTLFDFANPYAKYKPEDMFAFLKGHTLARAPGAQVEYSNMGAGLLGWALSRSQAMNYETMVRRLVCEPLGLRDTVVTLNAEQRGRMVGGVQVWFAPVGKPPVVSKLANWTFQECFAGAGALRSTAGDLLHFLAVNMGMEPSVMSGALRKTHEARVRENDKTEIGMGWIRTQWKGFEQPVVWHNGGTLGYRSFMGFSPESRRGVVVLCNTPAEEVDRMGVEILRMMIKSH